MKIIIVGGGISGLATYLYLRKNLPDPPAPAPPHSIHIYESHRPRGHNAHAVANEEKGSNSCGGTSLSQTTAVVGGGIGVLPNGMRVLRDLDSNIYNAVLQQGFPCENFIIMGQNGWRLGMDKTSDNGGFDGPSGMAEVCVSSSRHGLWTCLMAAVPSDAIRYHRVTGVLTNECGTKTLKFEDGKEEECDFLIGADGVKSAVRSSLFPSEGGEDKYRPTYTGLSGIGGLIKAPLPSSIVDKKALVFTLGRSGFFGYASGSPAAANDLMWLSTFETEMPPCKETLDTSQVKEEMQQRLSRWKDPVIQDIISRADVQSVHPTWLLPDLPHWGRNGIVLVGDAAHALSPITGQGASQALEDAQTLSLLLRKTLEMAYVGQMGRFDRRDEVEAVESALILFYKIRQPRVGAIADRSRKIHGKRKRTGIAMEYSLYFMVWAVTHVPFIAKMVVGDVNKRLYGWSAKEEVDKAFGLDTAGALRHRLKQPWPRKLRQLRTDLSVASSLSSLKV